jgi:hypothetical protein
MLKAVNCFNAVCGFDYCSSGVSKDCLSAEGETWK